MKPLVGYRYKNDSKNESLPFHFSSPLLAYFERKHESMKIIGLSVNLGHWNLFLAYWYPKNVYVKIARHRFHFIPCLLRSSRATVILYTELSI